MEFLILLTPSYVHRIRKVQAFSYNHSNDICSVHVLSLGDKMYSTEYIFVVESLLTYRAKAVNDGRDGGDSFTGTLERLVLTQLSTDSRGYQGEGTNDQTTLTTYKECLRQ